MFDVLGLSLGEKVHLLINNRWQFFYNKSLQNYSDDHRMLGEYPLPFDEAHLYGLAVELGIKVNIINVSCNMSNLKEYITRDGYVVIFANMYMLINNSSVKSKKCVTTILINEINDLYVKFNFYDNQIKHNIIDIKKIEQAWENASEYPFLNQSVVLISYDKVPTDNAIIHFFFKCIRNSIDTYMSLNQNNSFLQGIRGLCEFAGDIKELVLVDREILVDCAMHMELAIRQRECLLETIKKLNFSMDYSDLEKEITQIIDKWKNIRMFIYIVAQRKQFESLKFIGNQLYKLAEDEEVLLNKVRSIREENVKSISKE